MHRLLTATAICNAASFPRRISVGDLLDVHEEKVCVFSDARLSFPTVA